MIIAYEPSNHYFNLAQKRLAKDHNREFYDSLNSINNRPGYRRELDWNEYPLWIANLHRLIDTEIKVYSNARHLVSFIEINPNIQFDVYFYALESTENHIRGVIKTLEHFDNVIVFGNSLIADITVEVKDIKDIATYYNTTFSESDIPLVEINGNPRIYSTTGCHGVCTFCTVNNKTVMLDNIQNLTYNKNPDVPFYLGNLSALDLGISEFEKLPSKGRYIIQTTPTNILECENFKQIADKLAVVELGVEFIEDSVLKHLNKRYRTNDLYHAMNILYNLKIPVVFNMMVGLDFRGFHSNLVNSMMRNSIEHIQIMYQRYNNILGFNIFNYTDYNSPIKDDRNEHIFYKSWMTSEDRAFHIKYRDIIYSYSTLLLKRHKLSENKYVCDLRIATF